MSAESFLNRLSGELRQMELDGLLSPERILLSAQGPEVLARGADGTQRRVLNLCANDYLGLAGDPRLASASAAAAAARGAGLASVRFICGAQDLHKQLEAEIAAYVGHEDALLFAACFDANAAVFEPLLGEADAIVSDSLNHASIIDGARLSRARRYRFPHADMDALEAQLRAARVDGAKEVLIVTDGVFSMDGDIARLDEICALAERWEALVMVDDCHATGLLGPRGAGSGAHCRVEGRVDILTGTFGKALGGAMGGFVAARREVVETLRQRARPYLFSNSLAPPVCGVARAAIAISGSAEGEDRRTRLFRNARAWRALLTEAGFDLAPGEHPIVPVMLGEAALARDLAHRLFDLGVLVAGFAYPVVPQGRARVRTQVSADHTAEQLSHAAAAFADARANMGRGR